MLWIVTTVVLILATSYKWLIQNIPYYILSLVLTIQGDFSTKLDGKVFRKDDQGYEEARLKCCWNQRVPKNYPLIIVQANDEKDVVNAMKMAIKDNLKVSVCSGGHSFSANHMREGGLLLDLSRLNDTHIDKENMSATAGPGTKGHILTRKLLQAGLFFPSGHCPGVALGGYLLQGGFGWHSLTLGVACESVTAIDVVTANGDVVHASASENSDLYWAARGAGPGFFAVIIKYHLKLYKKPKVIGLRGGFFSTDMAEEVFKWAYDIGPQVSPLVEFQIIARNQTGIPGISVFAPVFADSVEEAEAATAFMDTAVFKGSRFKYIVLPFLHAPMSAMYAVCQGEYPSKYWYGVDNIWTGASFPAILPHLKKIISSIPSRGHSHMLWLNWPTNGKRQDMSFSMEDKLYLGLYTVLPTQEEDGKNGTWAVDRCKEMAAAGLSSGEQLADENLSGRVDKFMSDDNFRRLEQIRSVWDPKNRFFSYWGAPDIKNK